ncbi:MAG: RtcB family protein [Chloroflexota bacterium]|nr:RtcB family protein [Chloroflexota bacterium]
MIDTNALIQRYRGRADFGEIARFAHELGRAGRDEEGILAEVEARFGSGRERFPAAHDKPLAIYGERLIEANAIRQMESIMLMPPVLRGALMPDAHLGYAMPIGGVATLANAVSPSLIGYDISCMMMLSVFDATEAELEPDAWADVLESVTSFGLGADFEQPREHEVMDDPLWNEIDILRQLKPLAQRQLGSSGGGNHFANIMIYQGERVALLTHSGSRGTGYKLATHYVKEAERQTRTRYRNVPKGYEWLALDSESGQEYWAVMQLMGRYAQANHELIHRHFAEAMGLERSYHLWNRHNFAWRTDEGIIHRKGATPADEVVRGIIPGTSGTLSYVVEGLGEPASIYSSSHGAGRPYSRTEAKTRHDETRFRDHMSQQGILHRNVAADETFMAYKDIEEVLAEQVGQLVQVVGTLEPRVVLMGGAADDGD